MKLYELTCEISTNLSEEELKELIEKISSFISDSEGKIEKITDPLKRRLAYSISKNREIFLVNFVFEINPEKLGSLEKKIKSDHNIVRHMVLRKSDEKNLYNKISTRKKLPLEIEKEPAKDEAEEKIEEIEKKEVLKPKKVELKEIDQKIEEILND